MNAPLTVTEAAAGLRRGDYSAVELWETATRHADCLDEQLRVYITRFDDSAKAAAKAADRDFAIGRDRGPYQGIPVGIKDIVYTREAPTTGGSAVHNPAWQHQRDAPVVRRLREAGAVITGKTSMLELAVGVPDADYPLSETRTPWNLERWAGGSSSGSGAGVAANMFLAAIGTDTGGSIRLPSAYCGITGLKQSNGLVPRTDVIPLGINLDVVGPMARTASDVAAMLQIMAGRDPDDPTTAHIDVPDFSAGLGQSIKGLRVGVERKNHMHRDLGEAEVERCFEEAVAELRRAGAVVTEVELPYYQQGVDLVMMTLFAEGLAYHNTELREQWDAFSPATRTAFGNGALFNSGDYAMVQKVRRAIRKQVDRMFDDVDVVVCPTTVAAAPVLDGFSLPELVSAICTNYWNAVGNPVVSVPMGFTDAGLPVGMQIAGRAFDEVTVLRAADAFQRSTDWHLRAAPVVAAASDREENEHV